MPVNIIVAAKQVIDPETPVAALKVNAQARRMEPPPNVPPVVNGFDENAVEAALRIKEALGGKITVISVGRSFVLDVIKKPLSMGCDELVLVQDEALGDLDAFATAQVLAAAIKKVGGWDLILCGRQASDLDQAQVPLGLAELLKVPCITVAQKVEVRERDVIVERVLADGTEVMTAQLPVVVTVSNELGQPRYPTLRGIMAASRKQPVKWSLADLGQDATQLAAKVEVVEISAPQRKKTCEFITGQNDGEKGWNLARRLREAKLI
ncbi:MAG: electron transfer flavoprotein beta subunit/FixA family protein [Dehalococcoidia bacterium]|nr:electron transfer flavoprotein beta subunit/FixA family protein [Dehalococcoidia bacterium]